MAKDSIELELKKLNQLKGFLMARLPIEGSSGNFTPNTRNLIGRYYDLILNASPEAVKAHIYRFGNGRIDANQYLVNLVKSVFTLGIDVNESSSSYGIADAKKMGYSIPSIELILLSQEKIEEEKPRLFNDF